uniref:Uncharacterized protein n=1 Tax=Rhizophora mucronata TaxID=61149 RepID=A0A2P2IHE3_RHIMU
MVQPCDIESDQRWSVV